MTRREDGDGAPAAAAQALTHLEVNLDGLGDLRQLLRRELDLNLRPGVERITRDHTLGVGFGARNAGAQVQTARERYHDSLVISTANLTAYVQASQVLIDAIHQVTTTYRASDLTSADMLRLFERSITAVQTADLNASRADLAKDTARESARLAWERQQ